MTFIQILLLSMSLSVDSLAVSMSGSVSLGTPGMAKSVRTASILGIIQTAFFLGGCYAGDVVSLWVSTWGRYIGFALLLYVGAMMILDSLKSGEEQSRDFGSIWKVIVAAIATSIDAVAVGASFGLTGMDRGTINLAAFMIFAATVIFALVGIYFGSTIGRRFGKRCGLVAGIVLILIGVGLLR